MEDSKEATIACPDPDDTLRLGEKLGSILLPGDVITLSGDLGAGKTWLTKGIATGLGIPKDEVTSPSFTLVNEYQGRLPLFHMDFYRLGKRCDSDDLGLEEYFYGRGVSVIEWPEHFLDIIPAERLDVCLTQTGENERLITLKTRGKKWTERLAKLLKTL